ncbi:MAG TPA: sialidase family protein [Ideonella sp.]|nr:sialidase family protein [Ideonella sp.]
MIIDRRRLLSSTGAALALAAGGGRALAASSEQPYAWRNLPFGGGGFVSAIVLHPRRPGLAYLRCERGGVYRRDGHDQAWVPLLDHLGGADADLASVLAVALDPRDPERVFLACGDTTGEWSRKGAVMASSDRGATWTVHEQPFRLGGGEGGRGSGERLQVDPQDGRVLVLGTTRDGLLKSSDGGARFSALGLPARQVSLVLFDPAGAGQVFYAGSVDKPGLYITRDGGASFKREEGAPDQVPQRAAFMPDGTLVVSFAAGGEWPPNPGGLRGGGVWKRSPGGAWADITPSRPPGRPYAYGALDVDARGRIVTSMLLESWDGAGDELYLSADGGAHWTALSARSAHDTRGHPWLAARRAGAPGLGHQIADARFDPADAERLLYGTEYGLWSTASLGAAQSEGQRVQWRFDVAQIEQAQALALHSPSGGVMLFAGMGRGLGGGAWEDAAKAPDTGLFRPCRDASPSVDTAWAAPRIVARTTEGGTGGAVSLDGGASWTPFGPQSLVKDARGGHVAVSAKGGSLVWAPPRQPAMVSLDRGRSWRECKGWPATRDAELVPVAEKNAEGVFYVLDFTRGQVLVSVDAGQNFALSLTGLPELNPSWQRGFIVSAPGALRDLWIGLPDALVHVGGVDERPRTVKRVIGAERLALGKAAPGASYPSVYLAGRLATSAGTELTGLFRSDDAGASFRQIDNARQRFGGVVSLAADPLEHGVVYVGSRGRGIFVGSST